MMAGNFCDEEGDVRSMRILYVDDSRMVRETFAVLLKELVVDPDLNIDLVVYEFLEEAVTAYYQSSFDAVIVDGNIQNEGDGWAWASRLFSQGTRVLVLSSSHWPPDGIPDGLAYVRKGDSVPHVKKRLKTFLDM